MIFLFSATLSLIINKQLIINIIKPPQIFWMYLSTNK
jgi:hypothetical protein